MSLQLSVTHLSGRWYLVVKGTGEAPTGFVFPLFHVCHPYESAVAYKRYLQNGGRMSMKQMWQFRSLGILFVLMCLVGCGTLRLGSSVTPEDTENRSFISRIQDRKMKSEGRNFFVYGALAAGIGLALAYAVAMPALQVVGTTLWAGGLGTLAAGWAISFAASIWHLIPWIVLCVVGVLIIASNWGKSIWKRFSKNSEK